MYSASARSRASAGRRRPICIAGAHAVVTGGTRGIGLELSRELRRRGANVTIVARDSDRLFAVADELGGHAVPCDLAIPDQAADVVLRAERVSGPLDILVNNAGILSMPRPFSDLPPEMVGVQLITNLLAPLELMRAVLPGMLARNHGAIVNIGSIAGDAALPTQLGYCTTKSALITATRTLQRELRGSAVNALLIILGLVRTEMTEDMRGHPVSDALLSRFSAMSPLETTEIAGPIVEAIADGRQTLVLPRLAAPLHYLGALSTRLVDGLLMGIPRSGTATNREVENEHRD